MATGFLQETVVGYVQRNPGNTLVTIARGISTTPNVTEYMLNETRCALETSDWTVQDNHGVWYPAPLQTIPKSLEEEEEFDTCFAVDGVGEFKLNQPSEALVRNLLFTLAQGLSASVPPRPVLVHSASPMVQAVVDDMVLSPFLLGRLY